MILVACSSLADISQCNRDVRFTPESAHEMAIRDLRILSVALEIRYWPLADMTTALTNVRF